VFHAWREGPVNIHAGPGSGQPGSRWPVQPSRDRGGLATAGARAKWPERRWSASSTWVRIAREVGVSRQALTKRTRDWIGPRCARAGSARAPGRLGGVM